MSLTQTDLIDEINGWAGRVLRIYGELDESDNTDFWGPFDLVGTYHQRDRLESKLETPAPYILEAVDELLKSFSKEVGTGWITALGIGDELGNGWWWHMIPSRGPLLAELVDRVGESATRVIS